MHYLSLLKDLSTCRQSGIRQLKHDLDASHREIAQLSETLAATQHSHVQCQEEVANLQCIIHDQKEAIASLTAEICISRQALATEHERSALFKIDVEQHQAEFEREKIELNDLRAHKVCCDFEIQNLQEINMELREVLEIERMASAREKIELNDLRTHRVSRDFDFQQLQEIVRSQHETLGKCDVELDEMRAARCKDRQAKIEQSKEIARLKGMISEGTRIVARQGDGSHDCNAPDAGGICAEDNEYNKFDDMTKHMEHVGHEQHCDTESSQGFAQVMACDIHPRTIQQQIGSEGSLSGENVWQDLLECFLRSTQGFDQRDYRDGSYDDDQRKCRISSDKLLIARIGKTMERENSFSRHHIPSADDGCVGFVCRSRALAKRKASRSSSLHRSGRTRAENYVEIQAKPTNCERQSSQLFCIDLNVGWHGSSTLPQRYHLDNPFETMVLCQSPDFHLLQTQRLLANHFPLAERRFEVSKRLVEVEFEACLAASSWNTHIQNVTRADLEHISCNFTECLGAGSYGQVFAGSNKHCRLRGIARDVAIKMPCFINRHTEAQFLSELRVATFSHPDLMRLDAVCLDLHALVYPRAQRTLEEHLRSGAELAPMSALALLLGAARGLFALHDLRLLHRDVKGSNIFIFAEEAGKGSRAKLGDYGLVCSFVDKSFSQPSLVGTASYLDPMAILFGCCSWSSDIFSFGVVILEVVLRRSVTQVPSTSKQHWRQLHDAISRDSEYAVPNALTFIFSSGADKRWNSQALEVMTMLAADATRQIVRESVEMHRPKAGIVLDRLQKSYTLQEGGPLDEHCAGRTCTICSEEGINARMHPCCHALTCGKCASLFLNRECPLCRTIVDAFEIGRFESTFSPA